MTQDNRDRDSVAPSNEEAMSPGGKKPTGLSYMEVTALAADFLLAVFLLLVSAFIVVEAYRMPIRGPLDFATSPGLLPLALGLISLVLCCLLAVSSLRKGASQGLRPFYEQARHGVESHRLLVLTLGILVYVLSINVLPFYLSNFLFLTAIFFYLKAASWWLNLIIAGVTSIVVGYYMPNLFGMPLP